MNLKLQFLTPRDLKEALKFRADTSCRVIAGGTDLMVEWRRSARPSGVINLMPLRELRYIAQKDGAIEIGALSTFTDIINSKLILRCAPVLADAARTIGARQIQNRATIGGNIANASPAGDSVPPLFALNATLELASINDARWVPIAEFYTGYRQTVLRSDEILTRLRINPLKKGERAEFIKVGQRRAQAISKVVACFRINLVAGRPTSVGKPSPAEAGRPRNSGKSLIRDIALALGSVAPTCIRAYKTEELLHNKLLTPQLIEEAERSIMDEVSPIDDIRSTKEYRRFVVGTALEKFLISNLKIQTPK